MVLTCVCLRVWVGSYIFSYVVRDTGMFIVRLSYVPLLDAVACQCRLSFHSYVREVADDGTVVGGVELEVMVSGEPVEFRTLFFWGCDPVELSLLYEQAALKAIRFLQGLYGFVVADYNYEGMVGYRSLARSSVLLAVAVARSEHGSVSGVGLASAGSACPAVHLQLFCSQLVSSVHKV